MKSRDRGLTIGWACDVPWGFRDRLYLKVHIGCMGDGHAGDRGDGGRGYEAILLSTTAPIS